MTIAPAPLATRLRDSADQLAAVLPAEVLDVLAGEQAALVAGDDPGARLALGDVVESATLPDAHGRAVPVLGDQPAVIVFYRGAWCPFCNVALAAYQREVLPVLEELGVAFVAISPQGPSGTEEVVRAGGLTFSVLTDEGGRYAHSLGLGFDLFPEVREVHRTLGNDFGVINAGAEWSLPKPTVIVVDAERRVRFIDVRPDYTQRTESAAIIEAVRAMLRPAG